MNALIVFGMVFSVSGIGSPLVDQEHSELLHFSKKSSDVYEFQHPDGRLDRIVFGQKGVALSIAEARARLAEKLEKSKKLHSNQASLTSVDLSTAIYRLRSEIEALEQIGLELAAAPKAANLATKSTPFISGKEESAVAGLCFDSVSWNATFSVGMASLSARGRLESNIFGPYHPQFAGISLNVTAWGVNSDGYEVSETNHVHSSRSPGDVIEANAFLGATWSGELSASGYAFDASPECPGQSFAFFESTFSR